MKSFIKNIFILCFLTLSFFAYGDKNVCYLDALAPISDFFLQNYNRNSTDSNLNQNSQILFQENDFELADYKNVIKNDEVIHFSDIDISIFKKKSFKMNQLRSYISSVSTSPRNSVFRESYDISIKNPELFQKNMNDYMSNRINNDETLEDDINFQSSHLEQAGVELIANAIDAMGDFTGRFGIGFLQILQELKTENDRVEVCTKKDGFDAVRIIFIKIDNEYRVCFEKIEEMKISGTTIHVIKNDFLSSRKDKLANYIRRKIRLSRKAKIIRNEDNKYFLMNHLNDFKLINGDSIGTYEINDVNVSLEIRDNGYSISDKGRGMNIQDVLEKLIPSRRSNNNYWFKKINMHDIEEHTAVFYKESSNQKKNFESLIYSRLSVLVNGYEIETHITKALNLPEEFVIDLPLAVSQIESRDHLIFNKYAVTAFETAIDKICRQEIAIETKISLLNAMYSMIDSFSHYEKNIEYTKKILNYCKKSFREKVLPNIDKNQYQLLPNEPEFEGIKTDKNSLFINPNLIRWSLPTISGMRIIEDFVSQTHRLFLGNWKQEKEGPIYVKIGDDIIVNAYYYNRINTKLSKLLINLLWTAHTSYGERQKEKGKLAIDEEWFKIEVNKDLRPKIDDILYELEADKILSKDDIAGLKLVFTGHEDSLDKKLKLFLERYKDIKKIVSQSNIPLERVGFVKFVRSLKLKDLSKKEKKFDNIQTISRPFQNYPNILQLRVMVVTGGWYSSETSYYTFLYDLKRNEWMHVPELPNDMIKGHINERIINDDTYLFFDKMYENSENKNSALFKIDKYGHLQPCQIKGNKQIWFKHIDGPYTLGKYNFFLVRHDDKTSSIIDLKTNEPLKLQGIKYKSNYDFIKILYNQQPNIKDKTRYIFLKSKNEKPFIYDCFKNKVLKLENFLELIGYNAENIDLTSDHFSSMYLDGSILELKFNEHSSSSKSYYWDLEKDIYMGEKFSNLPDFIKKENPMNVSSININGKEHYICYINNEKTCIFDIENKIMKSFNVNGKPKTWFSEINIISLNGRQVIKLAIGDEYEHQYNYQPYQCGFFDIESGEIINLPYTTNGWFNSPIEYEHIPEMGYTIMAIKDRNSYNYIDLNTMKSFDFNQYNGMPEENEYENKLKNDVNDFENSYFITSALEHVNPLNGKKGDYWIFSNGIIVNQKKKEYFFNYLEILYRYADEMNISRYGNDLHIKDIILDRYVFIVNRFMMSNYQYYLFDTQTKQFINLPDYIVYGENTYASIFKNRLLINNKDRNHLYDFLTDRIIPLPFSNQGYFDEISIIDNSTLLTYQDGEARIVDFLSQPSLETGDPLTEEMIEIASSYINEKEEEFSDNPKILETYLSNLLLGKYSKIEIPFKQLNPLLPYVELSQLNLLTKEALNELNEEFLQDATDEAIETLSLIFDVLKGRIQDPKKFSSIVLRWMELIVEDEKEAKKIGERLKEFGKYFDESLDLNPKEIDEGYLAEYVDYLLGNGEILTKKRSVAPLMLSKKDIDEESLNSRYGISLAELVLAVQNRRDLLRKKDLTITELEEVLKEFSDWNKDPVKGEIFSTIFGQDPNTWIREIGQNARDAIRSNKKSKKDENEVFLDSYIDKNNNWAFTITDPVGVELWELINLFFIPGASGKRGKNELSGKFGKGLLTIFADADEIEVITSPKKNAPAHKMILKVERDYDGTMIDIKIMSLEKIKTDFKGTRIKRIKHKSRNIEALIASRSVYRYLSGIKESDTKFYYKGVKVNENLEEVGYSENDEIGKVSVNLSPFGFSRIMVDGLYLDEITDERMGLVHDVIKKMFHKDELVISLSDKISLLSTRGASQEKIEEQIKNGIAAAMLKAALTLYIQKGRRIPDLPQDFFTNKNDFEHPDNKKIQRIIKDAELINEEKWDQVDLYPYTGTKRDIIQLLIRVRDIHNAKTLEEMKKMDHKSFNNLNTGNNFMNRENEYRKDEIDAEFKKEALRDALKNLGFNEDEIKSSNEDTIFMNHVTLNKAEKHIIIEATRALAVIAGYPETIIGEYKFESEKTSAGSTWMQNNHGQFVPAILWNFSSSKISSFLKHVCIVISDEKIPNAERFETINEFFDTILHEITHFTDKDNMSHEADGIIDDAFITRFKTTLEKFIRMEFSVDQFINYLLLIQAGKEPNLATFDFTIKKAPSKRIKKQIEKAA